jgi:ArsR family transcriptional regulator
MFIASNPSRRRARSTFSQSHAPDVSQRRGAGEDGKRWSLWLELADRGCPYPIAPRFDFPQLPVYYIFSCWNIQKGAYMTEFIGGFEAQAHLFQALSHPVRLRILDILARQEACVCHLTCALGRRQPYVSQQLATLREAGIVADRREGTLIYYRLADDHVASLLDEGKALVGALAGDSLAFPAVPDKVLENCPCPRCQAEA